MKLNCFWCNRMEQKKQDLRPVEIVHQNEKFHIYLCDNCIGTKKQKAIDTALFEIELHKDTY